MNDNLNGDQHKPGQPTEVIGGEANRMQYAGYRDGKKRPKFIEIRGG